MKVISPQEIGCGTIGVCVDAVDALFQSITPPTARSDTFFKHPRSYGHLL